jgi:N-methylhydantoinase A
VRGDHRYGLLWQDVRTMNDSKRYSLGVDIGGTFTDVAVYDHHEARAYSRKVLTTHGNPSEAVMQGVDAVIGEYALDPDEFQRVVHATTLFTNALIERRGAATGLLTTRGFRDVLEIGRERKFELYDLAIQKPTPLAPRNLRAEVDERLMADGTVLRALDEDALVATARALVGDGAQSLALVFLHAWLNPDHEQRAARVLRDALPGTSITASHEVAPEIREFERASTTVANAYVKPLAEHYLDALAAGLAQRGIACDPALMMSSGGLTHLAEAKRAPVQLLESGPAAGALAAAFFGSDDADGRLLAFDMGGTTAKLSVVDAGEPLTAYGFEAARQRRFIEGSGLPIRISTIELIEIGAGGGSIAAPDRLGLIKVGPRSAGSEPGPAAYGRGGDDATVTDADFLLGYLNPDYFAGGRLSVDMAACRDALDRTAKSAGLSAEALAFGIHDIVNENMASAARVHFAERGKDPRDYTLLCTGGAGPVHAYYLARKLRIRSILCPPSAGVASALGLLVAPARVDRVASIGFRLERDSLADLEQAFTRLEADAREVLNEGGLAAAEAAMTRRVDGRFIGQGYDLTVELPAGPYDGDDPQAVRARLREAFEAAYREKYQRTPDAVPLEFMNARIAARLPLTGGDLRLGPETAEGEAKPQGHRPVWWQEADGFVDTAVWVRAALPMDTEIRGPAVIEEEGSTLVVGPAAGFRVLSTGNLRIDLDSEE